MPDAMPDAVQPAAAIPSIDVSALFADDLVARSMVDRHIRAAAMTTGFMVIRGLPAGAAVDAATRQRLLQIFALPESETRKLWRWNFDATHQNVYRGWFPLQDGHATYKEGIDIGPDLVHGAGVVDRNDPLREATPLPPEVVLPGWRAAAQAYYRSMVRIAAALMQSIARGLGLPETTFDAAFDGGISTLRLIRYPVRPPASFGQADADELWTVHEGERRYLTGRAHADSGFITLLAQDGVSGLQAQQHDGSWIDIPPTEETLAVNFGKVLERWTGGRVRATVHRVLGSGVERRSIPFFYEPRVDAVIAPLPLEGAGGFAPFYFGDHLWEVTTKFVEQRGIAHLRRPLGPPPA